MTTHSSARERAPVVTVARVQGAPELRHGGSRSSAIATRSLLARRAYLAEVVTEIGLPQLAGSEEETESLGRARENNNRLEVHESGSSYLTLEIVCISQSRRFRSDAIRRITTRTIFRATESRERTEIAKEGGTKRRANFHENSTKSEAG